MTFQLPRLPYAQDALAPTISKETLEVHHGKHHAAYVKKLNDLLAGTDKAEMSLEDLIRSESGGLFNQAAQAWNHDFYWKSMRPGGAAPDVELERLLTKEFGSLQKLKEAFGKAATGHFGSGWAWLVQVNSGELAVLSTHDADNPLRTGQTPLLTCDVWEHAYYIDYRNKRQDYVEAWWKLADWSFVKQNLAVGASAE